MYKLFDANLEVDLTETKNHTRAGQNEYKVENNRLGTFIE